MRGPAPTGEPGICAMTGSHRRPGSLRVSPATQCTCGLHPTTGAFGQLAASEPAGWTHEKAAPSSRRVRLSGVLRIACASADSLASRGNLEAFRHRVKRTISFQRLPGGGRETRLEHSLKNGGFGAFFPASVVDRDSRRQPAVDSGIAYAVAPLIPGETSPGALFLQWRSAKSFRQCALKAPSGAAWGFQRTPKRSKTNASLAPSLKADCVSRSASSSLQRDLNHLCFNCGRNDDHPVGVTKQQVPCRHNHISTAYRDVDRDDFTAAF